MFPAATSWMVLAALVLAVPAAGCGDDDDDATDGDADADSDADSDADADGDGDGDGDGDADVGPCGGTGTLTVHVQTGIDAPLAEAEVALDCGPTRLDGVTDAAGDAVFDGLDLATTPVDVTAFHPDTNAVSILGVREASEPLSISLTPLAFDPSSGVQVSGEVLATEPGSLTYVSVSRGGYFPFEDAYQLVMAAQDEPRFTGLEVRPEDDGTATPLAWFDATVPMPAAGEGPDLALAATTFTTADVAVTFVDDRMAVRQVPMEDSPLGISSRHLVGALLYDLTEDRRGWNLVGLTMATETDGLTDTLRVAWPAGAVTRPVTRLHLLSENADVGVFAQTSVAPDEVGPISAPEPPTLADVQPGEPLEVGPDDIAIDRPAWADGATAVALLPAANNSGLWVPGFMSQAYWIVVSLEPADTLHIPAAPGGHDYADVLGLSDLQLLVSASNAVDPADGVSWTAVDARYAAFAP